MSKVETATYPTPWRREVARIILSPFLRSDIIKDSEYDGLSDFENLIESGFGGIVLLKHFSLKDPPQSLKDIAGSSRVLINRQIESANAAHQIYPGVRWLGDILGIHIHPIVTRNTVDRARGKGKPEPRLNEGTVEFTTKALSILSHGGLLFLAPEAERKTNLEPYETRTIGTFLAAAKRSGVDNIAFLFIDLRLAGKEEGYWSKKGFNLLSKYEVRIGRARTLEQIMEAAGRKLGDVDRLAILPEMQRTAAIQRPRRMGRFSNC